MRFALAIFVLTMTCSPSLAETREFAVEGSGPILLSNPHTWNSSDCTLGAVNLVVVEEPTQGRVYARSGDYEIGDFGPGRRTSGSGDQCLGQLITGTQVLYQPNKSFSGEDRFVVVFDFDEISDLRIEFVARGHEEEAGDIASALSLALRDHCQSNIVLNSRYDCSCAASSARVTIGAMSAQDQDQLSEARVFLNLEGGAYGCANEAGIRQDVTDWCMGHLSMFNSGMPQGDRSRVCQCNFDSVYASFSQNPILRTYDDLVSDGMVSCIR